MGIRLQQLLIYKPADSLREFVDFWAGQYNYEDEHSYDRNIKGPHTRESLFELFKWKIGSRFSAKRTLVERHFISRFDEAKLFWRDLQSHELRDSAKNFLEQFSTGGAIWRIFWLHCWFDQFPIYDQHVHRAMTFMEDGEGEELSPYSDRKKIQLYLDRYLPFFASFKELDDRKVDKALWQFGKSIKAFKRNC